MVELITPPAPKCRHCGDPRPFSGFFHGVPLYGDCPKPHTHTMVFGPCGIFLIPEVDYPDAKPETQ